MTVDGFPVRFLLRTRGAAFSTGIFLSLERRGRGGGGGEGKKQSARHHPPTLSMGEKVIRYQSLRGRGVFALNEKIYIFFSFKMLNIIITCDTKYTDAQLHTHNNS